MTIKPKRPNAKQGRAPATEGRYRCDRCLRRTNQIKVRWPGEDLCFVCHWKARRTRGICSKCGHQGVLPANEPDTGRPVCRVCAGIAMDFRCRQCGTEDDFYRRGICARCALRNDLTVLMLDQAHDRPAMSAIVDAFCNAERPESILTWKRNPTTRALLSGLASGRIPLSHSGLDGAGTYQETRHIRSVLEHHGVLPVRDESLARFESWLAQKLDSIASAEVRAPIAQFATWHHLRRVRAKSTPRRGSAPATSYAKQEITEAIKFLTWLHEHHHRSAADCTQQDVDEWVNSGPTTRVKIQGIIHWFNRTRLNTSVQMIPEGEAPYSALSQEQRLAWIRELVVCEAHALPSRIAGILLLLYGQPLTKIAGLRTSAVTTHDGETRILLGQDPIPVPEPFATMLNNHLAARPNLQAAGGSGASIPWLFPGMSPGHHLTAQHIMRHLRHMGIHLRGARNTALQAMVVDVPPPIVAEMLGYGHKSAQRHADIAARTWGGYVTPRPTTRGR